MATFLQDLRYGVRVLLKAPGFTLVAVLTLALGIGANSAMFSIVNGVLLRGLPFPDPGRIVKVYTTSPQFSQMSSSYPNFVDWAVRQRSFAPFAAYRTDSFNLTGQGQPERVHVAMVSASFFDLLGLEPVLGRTFTAAEDKRNGNPVVVLAEPYWKQRFGGDPGGIPVGQRLEGQDVEQAEDRGVRADAERERQHGGRGERGASPRQPPTLTNIAQYGTDRRQHQPPSDGPT